MPASIGVNLRVTGHCRQGGRKYMEDFFSVAYQQTEDEKDLEYAFFGIYDGHGGGEAATFAKEHLMESIVRQKNFWSDKDEDVLKAIKEGYIATHYAMWKEQEKWPKTASGLPSTAGTTASVAFIRRGKIYIGHVGDSGIILGYQEQPNQSWKARPLTKDHKPENESEMSRIAQCGGKVVTKSGVPRVVWNRPRIGHKGPVRRSTPIDEIPFLAVARSLGDLWSYNSALDEFVVSPDPDTCVVSIDADSFRCLIFGTDGLWNMISPATAVNIVQVAEQHNEQTVLATADSSNPQQEQQQSSTRSKVWLNPSKCLVERALDRWNSTKMRADNTSVITLMLDPPGPPRAEVIKNQKLLSENRLSRRLDQQSQQISMDTCGETQKPIETTPEEPGQSDVDKSCSEPPPYPENGLEIVTVYRDEASSIIQSVIDAVTSEGTETPHHDTYLEKIHREVLNSIQNKQPAAEEKSAPTNKEIIQINEVSSSSQEKSATEDNAPCARCTRSHDASRKLLRTSKPVRSSSESPKRKTRSVLTRRIVGGSKREHSEPEQENGRLLAEGTCLGKVACPADEGRLGEAPGCSSSEPPQKLRRSRSLEPRDFTLRSSDAKSRLLRDRDRALAGRHSLATMVPASGSAFKRLSSTRSFTPLRSPIQTRNRVKRLSNK